MKPILVHVHIYYPNMWEELKNCLSNISSPYDLYVTMVEEHIELHKDIILFKPKANIQIIDNRGYDIGPFVHILNQVNLDKYTYIIKLHTKRDVAIHYPFLLDNMCEASGNKWRKYLLSFCSTKENWEKTINLLNSNAFVGMVSDKRMILEFIYDKSTITKDNAYKIMKDLDLPLNQEVFVMGTMFIVKAELFKVIQNRYRLIDFHESESNSFIKNMNNLEYSLEHVFGLIVTSQGMEIQDYDGKLKLYNYRRWARIIYYNMIKITYSIIIFLIFLVLFSSILYLFYLKKFNKI